MTVNETFVATRRALPGFVTILLMFLGAAGPMRADADGGNPNLVHACVNRWTQVRIVAPNDACDPGERSIHWVLTGPEGPAPQPGQATCPTGSLACGGAGCTNVMTDVRNCGACGRACRAGQACSAGVCQTVGATCPAGTNLCPSSQSCVNFATDLQNCGGCGIRCATGQGCYAGLCR